MTGAFLCAVSLRAPATSVGPQTNTGFAKGAIDSHDRRTGPGDVPPL